MQVSSTRSTKSIVSDIETVSVMHDLMPAIGVGDFQIQVNNRKVLSGLLQKLGLAHQTAAILRSIDKLPKIGPDKVVAEMIDTSGVTLQQATQVLRLTGLSGDNDELLVQIQPLIAGDATGEFGWNS